MPHHLGWPSVALFLTAWSFGLDAHSATPLACDANASGGVDAVDVQLVVNSVLGLPVAPGLFCDLDGSETLDAVDVQLVVNAVLGLTVDGDLDGLTDPYEANLGTHPGLQDTDGDGVGDGEEVLAGTDPLTSDSGSVVGTYDPNTGLVLQGGGLVLELPPGASPIAITISMRRAQQTDYEVPPPAGAGFVGAHITADGQITGAEGTLRLRLPAASLLPGLPVLTYDETNHLWKGTGEMATVGMDGMDVEIPVPHFSILGVPENVPLPDPGDPVGSFVVLSNNGNLATEGGVSSPEAALLYSEFGKTFSISAMSQTINDQGHIETKAMGFSSILVLSIDNYVVGVVGGENSLYNGGQFNEPAVGVMIMSVKGSKVSVSIYAATPDRTITGTLTGTTS